MYLATTLHHMNWNKSQHKLPVTYFYLNLAMHPASASCDSSNFVLQHSSPHKAHDARTTMSKNLHCQSNLKLSVSKTVLET